MQAKGLCIGLKWAQEEFARMKQRKKSNSEGRYLSNNIRLAKVLRYSEGESPVTDL